MSLIGLGQNKNKIINGNFSIWQRNTNFTDPGNTYTADRWNATLGTGGTPALTVSRQTFALGQTAVPGEPQFYLNFNQTGVATTTQPELRQRIEGVRTFSGQVISVSFWAKAGSALNLTTGNVLMTQNFGTGGAPSSEVETALDSQTISITTGWTKFKLTITVPSISGKTLGTNNNDFLEFAFKFPLSTTFTFDISNVQIEKGLVSTDFEDRSFQQELVACQRYYEKTFPYATAPVQNAGVEGALRTIGGATGSFISWVYNTPKKVGGSVQTYNPSAADTSFRNITDSTDTAVGTPEVNEFNCFIAAITDATDDNDLLALHATVESEM